MAISLAGGVAPFGDPGITDRSHLPRAFRSVPRPSSPLSAKASTRCPSLRSIRGVFDLVPPAGPLRVRPEANPTTPRNPTAHRGKPPRHGLSHEDTSPDGPGPPAPACPSTCLAHKPQPAPRGPSASVAFTNSLHPINQHRSREPPAAGAEPLPPGCSGTPEPTASPNAAIQTTKAPTAQKTGAIPPAPSRHGFA